MHGLYSNFLYVLLLNLQLKVHKMSGSFPSGTESGVSVAVQPTSGSDSASSSNTLANLSYPVDMESHPTREREPVQPSFTAGHSGPSCGRGRERTHRNRHNKPYPTMVSICQSLYNIIIILY